MLVDDEQLELTVENKKVTTKQDAAEKMGFGIENTRNRLNLMYAQQYQLDIMDTSKYYTVHLKLTLL